MLPCSCSTKDTCSVKLPIEERVKSELFNLLYVMTQFYMLNKFNFYSSSTKWVKFLLRRISFRQRHFFICIFFILNRPEGRNSFKNDAQITKVLDPYQVHKNKLGSGSSVFNSRITTQFFVYL